MELSDQEIEWAKGCIQRTGLFINCSESEMEQLIDGLDKQEYHCSSTILFQGEISSRLCLVYSGKVSIFIRSKGKDKIKVAELGPDAFFGEISLLTPRAATATVKAEADTEIIFLPGEVVQSIVKNNPVLSDKINKKIEERLASQKKKPE